MRLAKLVIAILAISLISVNVKAQNRYINDVQLRLDSNVYSLRYNSILYQGSKHLNFYYDQSQPFAVVELFPNPEMLNNIKKIELMSSGDFEKIDSLYLFDSAYYQTKVQFFNLNESQFLKFVFKITLKEDMGEIMFPVQLLPYTSTSADLYIEDNQLFVGEQKSFEIITNNFYNIRFNNAWTKKENYDYRLDVNSGKLMLYMLPHETGNITLELDLTTKRPTFHDGQLSFTLSTIKKDFVVKASRLKFLSLDADEVEIMGPDKDQLQVQIDNHPSLKMNKTYRIEDIEEPGGELVGELFVRRYLNNNRVLAWLRTYKYHQQSDGYLYIKDGDEALFLTNFNIVPPPTIEHVTILRQGKEWTRNLNVHPGEEIEVKIEGKSLHRSNFQFMGATLISSDSLLNNPNRAVVELQIPMNIIEKKVEIQDNGENTGFSLNVNEYQKPRKFDFIAINYGEGKRLLNQIEQPILYENTIQDVIIDFEPEVIDRQNDLYGRQYISIDIKITNKKNELIELRELDNIVVCPGENSPRYNNYLSPVCQIDNIQLNQLIRKKTYDLPEWSKIELTFSHIKARYGGEGIEKTIEIYNKRSYGFDIDVSFPAGLIEITQPEEGDDKVSNLTGISMAALAQISFYHKRKIARYQPYKIGIGFLAINAFNFNANETQRDLGIVILGSLYPTTKDVKLSFPLFIGGGYYLNKEKLFFVIGPGIRLSL